MRIQRAQIFGFGKWIDEVFEFNDEPFICFYGKNEAGKSTLQQFFLYMLFGLPPRKLSRYKPKYSSQIGGTLTIHFSNVGEVTIERVESDFRLFLPDGTIEEDETVLQTKLNDLQEETYRAIYGFSSLDLFQLHKMKQQQLSDLLFSVSLTGSTAVYELERTFSRNLDELFKKAGRRPLINEQITKVNKLEKDVVRSKREVLSYRHKIKERNECEHKLATLNEQLLEQNETYTLREKMLQFLPQIRTYKRVKAELQTLRELQLSFPENGIERYEQLKQQLVPISAEYKSIEQTITQYEQSVIDIKKNLFVDERYDEIAELIAKHQRLESDERQLEKLSDRIVQLHTTITEHTNRLHLSEEDVASFQPPFHAESTWKQLMDESKQLQYESERIEEASDLIEQKRKTLHEEQKRISADFIGFDQLRKFEMNESKRTEQYHEYTSLQMKHDWEKKRFEQSKKWSYIMSFVTVVFFMISFIQTNFAYFMFSSAFLLSALFQFYSIYQMKQRMETLAKQLEEMNHLTNRSGNLPGNLTKQKQLANELMLVKESLKDLQIEQLQWEEKNNHFSLKEHKWISAVELEREKIPLLQQVELDYWIEWLHHIEKINEVRSERDQLQMERDVIEEKLFHFKESIQQLGARIAPNEKEFTMRHVHLIMEEHLTMREQIKQYEQLKDEATKRLEVLHEEKRVIEKQIKDLFQMTKVTTEESFYKTARQKEEQRQLETSWISLKDQLEAVFSTENVAEIMKGSLDEYALQQEVQQIQTTIEELDKKQESIKQRLTTLQVEINQLESSDDYSYQVHVYELERDKLNMLAEEWAKIKVAEAILQEAKWSYQQKYISDVMAYTSNYFSFLTLERYIAVYPPTETNSFQVEASNKMRYTVEELSKGTIDQLYVALRFAISKVMSEKFVVPLMIDDAFVHFDEERAALAVQLLEEVSQEQQVILYTCQKHVADSVSEMKSLRVDL